MPATLGTVVSPDQFVGRHPRETAGVTGLALWAAPVHPEVPEMNPTAATIATQRPLRNIRRV